MTGRVDAVLAWVVALGFFALTVVFGLEATVYVLAASYWQALAPTAYTLFSGGMTALLGLFGAQSWRWNRRTIAENAIESR